jgi:hypothetical protein
MSYEGREFILCKSGHLNVRDAMEFLWTGENQICGEGTCEEDLWWCISVDDTNGWADDPVLPVVSPEVTHTCSCGDVHVTKPGVYAPVPGEGYYLDDTEEAIPRMASKILTDWEEEEEPWFAR